jgi:tRNA pseudouridine55 synthase
VSGVLVVDKPCGPSSFAVVRRVRGALARRWNRKALKIGHGGTLDPMASGVLPVCVGEATKLAPFLLGADKEYEATVRFGVETDTLDAEGEVVAQRPAALEAAEVEAALGAFRGPIEQVPPMYAALKRQGRPLYEYARAGQTLERAPRAVTIHELVLVSFVAPDTAHLRVRCSKGTYVRVLAADLGRALGPGAHLASLRRVGSGPFQIAAALPLDELVGRIASGQALPFVSCADALAHLPAVRVSEDTARALRRGQRLGWEALGQQAPPAQPLRALDEPDGALVAVVAAGGAGAGNVVTTMRVFLREKAEKPASDVDSTGVS